MDDLLLQPLLGKAFPFRSHPEIRSRPPAKGFADHNAAFTPVLPDSIPLPDRALTIAGFGGLE
jgi:hypothetical protein